MRTHRGDSNRITRSFLLSLWLWEPVLVRLLFRRHPGGVLSCERIIH